MTKIISFAEHKNKRDIQANTTEGGTLPLEGLFSAAYVCWYLCGDEALGDYFYGILNHHWWETGEWQGFVTKAAYDQYVVYATEKKRYVYPLKTAETSAQTA